MIFIDKWLNKYSVMPEVDKAMEIIPLQAKPPPSARHAVQASKETQAKEEVSAITEIALDAGWEPDQLNELARIMKVFMPCKIGSVRLEAIEILLLDAGGEVRGANRFYNMRTEQPWIKKVNIPPGG